VTGETLKARRKKRWRTQKPAKYINAQGGKRGQRAGEVNIRARNWKEVKKMW